MKNLIVIAGPTASGKTSLSIELAKTLNAPIISADSRQFYKELSIGTAKPSKEEMEGVPHYFIDSHSIVNPVSAGRFEKEALEKIEKLSASNDYIIIAGGSGMFIDALIYGTDKIPHDKKWREHWNQQFENKGIKFLQNKLKSIDPKYYSEVDLNNPHRLIRALEVHSNTGKSFSSYRNNKRQHRFPLKYFVINHPREKLYERINKRVDLMIENGLIEEVKVNLKHRDLLSLNTVGYKELFDYFDGKIDINVAIELIKRNTRRYAKRQLTWFRKEENAIWLTPYEVKKMVKTILDFLD
ncbi:MAG: tRNA (adenosine(37)-N6)-dimethylallyltransferase MiaA [Brumimicrobium sp.]